MRKYPFLISFALLYWGINTDNLLIALIFMILLESHRLIKFRWDFSTNDFNMISVLSTLGSIGYLIYYSNSSQETGFISSFLIFLPVLLFPLNFFYLYSTSENINAKKLFLLFVVNKYSIVHPYTKRFRPDYIFFCSLLIGGSISAGLYSFPVMILLILPLLFINRSQNYKFITWFLSLLIVISIALILQISMSKTFYFIKYLATDIYINNFMKHTNRNSTIGSIGDKKNDYRIELRMKIYDNNKPFYHLKENIYNFYHFGTWQSHKSENKNFSQIYFEYGNTKLDSMRIFFFSSGRRSRVKSNFKTSNISGISENDMSMNSLGTITVKDPQYLVDYKVYSRKDPITYLFGDPNEIDLQLNPVDKNLVQPIIDSLGLRELPFKKINRKLSNYFISNYRYSLDYIKQKDHSKLQNFITDKKGHCELFATLTCLIYRELGYPSRYVTGYLVSEYDDTKDLYIARQKDRHAWVYANDNEGNWFEYDTTPPDIFMNRSGSGILGGVYDFVSNLYYKAFLFKAENNELFKNILLLSIIPLALFLLYRILRGVRYKSDIKKNTIISHYEVIKELYQIREKLKDPKIDDHETLAKWFERIGTGRRNEEIDKLKNVQSLYYNKRYFPEGFTKELDEKLKKYIEDIT
ncbi:MAG: transglutaminase domain-containing protein [Candidatus Delongbacteria bacterium]|nr:transglutaminase domain-containing protein [Candidatus Delongbacteria bacterium]